MTVLYDVFISSISLEKDKNSHPLEPLPEPTDLIHLELFIQKFRGLFCFNTGTPFILNFRLNNSSPVFESDFSSDCFFSCISHKSSQDTNITQHYVCFSNCSRILLSSPSDTSTMPVGDMEVLSSLTNWDLDGASSGHHPSIIRASSERLFKYMFLNHWYLCT